MTPLILSTAMVFTGFDKRRNYSVIGIPSKKRKNEQVMSTRCLSNVAY